MANEEKGYWFSTENGTHIHAEEGESKESAMKKKFSKFEKTESKKDSTFEEINEKRMGTEKGYNPSNRDESTKNHNKIINSINARYSNNRISKEEYWKQIDEEVDRWNEEQEKHWKDDRPEWANKIDKEMKPTFDSAKQIDSIYKNAKEKNLDFERSLLNDIKSNPDKYNKIVLGDKEYVRKGNGFDVSKNGKHEYTGTYNSVAKDINDFYEDTETKLNDSKKISYDEFFESPSNKQIVDDYVEDFIFRARRNNEQDSVGVDKVLKEFKKDWVGFYSEETLPHIKKRIQEKLGK